MLLMLVAIGVGAAFWMRFGPMSRLGEDLLIKADEVRLDEQPAEVVSGDQILPRRPLTLTVSHAS